MCTSLGLPSSDLTTVHFKSGPRVWRQTLNLDLSYRGTQQHIRINLWFHVMDTLISMGTEPLMCLIKHLQSDVTWELSLSPAKEILSGPSVLLITEKIICPSEPPRSLISFVPIDLTAISVTGGAAGLGAGSMQLLIRSPTTLCTWQLWKPSRRRRSSSIIQKVLVSLKLPC